MCNLSRLGFTILGVLAALSPNEIYLEGELDDRFPDGRVTCDFAATVWDAQQDGNPLGPVEVVSDSRAKAPGIEVVDRRFQVLLDLGELSVRDRNEVWIEVDAACPSGAEWLTLEPRIAVSEVIETEEVMAQVVAPLRIAQVAGAPDGHSLDAADGSPVDVVFVDNAGNILVTGNISRPGTTPLEFSVNGAPALRLEHAVAAPNVIAGHPDNSAVPGTAGVTILGGGDTAGPNVVSADFGTITGGFSNEVFGAQGTVHGGANNTAAGEFSTVSGGQNNYAGGVRNMYSAVNGGLSNTASGWSSVVGGGSTNSATGQSSTVAGGEGNTAGPLPYSAVPGGFNNTAAGAYSFAAGRRAKALHAGSFVWADNTDADFASTLGDQFAIRASNGVILEGLASSNPTFTGRSKTGTHQAPAPVTTNSVLAYFAGSGWDGTAWPSDKASLGFYAAEPWTTSAHGSLMSFSTIPLTSTAATERMRIAANGDVGIGTKTPNAKLDVAGSLKVDASTLFVDDVNNRVGLGTTTPSAPLDVVGNTVLNGNLTVDAPTLFVNSTNNRVGIGTTGPNSTLEVAGSLRVDTATLFVNDTANRVGIGTLNPGDTLDVYGHTILQGNLTVDLGTLFVDGSLNRVGVGTTIPQNRLDVEGNVAIGASYSGTSGAPPNGLIVQGNVGIGTASPAARLDVNGDYNVNGAFKIRGQKPFFIQHYLGVRPNTSLNTGVPSNAHICWVGSFVAKEGDIQESGERETIIKVQVTDSGTSWVINANFATHNDNGDEKWDIDIICASKDLIEDRGTVSVP